MGNKITNYMIIDSAPYASYQGFAMQIADLIATGEWQPYRGLVSHGGDMYQVLVRHNKEDV